MSERRDTHFQMAEGITLPPMPTPAPAVPSGSRSAAEQLLGIMSQRTNPAGCQQPQSASLHKTLICNVSKTLTTVSDGLA